VPGPAQEAEAASDDIIHIRNPSSTAFAARLGSTPYESAPHAHLSTPTPIVEPVPVLPSTPLPRNVKKKKGGRWAGHIKGQSRAETPVKTVAPLAVSSPFNVGTPGPTAAFMAGVGGGSAAGGHLTGEVDLMDEAAKAHWDEEVHERRRREFGMGIGSSSWW